MSKADAIKAAQETAQNELSDALADFFGVVSFGTPGTEANNKIDVTMSVKNAKAATRAQAEIVRLTCEEGATMAKKSAGKGTVISGSGTNDMIVETDASDGTFDVEVSYASTGDVHVVAGPTQGSGFISCANSATLTFA